jgi:hypothetical protein
MFRKEKKRKEKKRKEKKRKTSQIEHNNLALQKRTTIRSRAQKT